MVRQFVASLLGNYTIAAAATAVEPAAADERLAQLTLAHTALRDLGVDGSSPTRPPQIVILGPTQSGKSTVVNIVAGCRAAQVSPLAGFTIHPQGFLINPTAEAGAWADRMLPGRQRCEQSALDREHLESYALEVVTPALLETAGWSPRVFWDTPDFDSLAARAYQRGVLELAALADAWVLVLSKEKYSDLSVWRMLALLAPLDRPLLICLNKMTPEAEETIVESLRARLHEHVTELADAKVVALPHRTDIDKVFATDAPQAVDDLRRAVAELAQRLPDPRRAQAARALVRKHFADWIEPIQAEHAAAAEWDRMVKTALAELLADYRRDYLEHAQRFDAFRRAVIELLHLLEVPALAGTLGTVRQVLTWPARQLFAAREAWRAKRRQRADRPHGLGSEEVVLFNGVDKCLTGLARDIARRSAPSSSTAAFWRALGQQLAREESGLRERFQSAIREHHQRFQAEIQAAASKLYETLQERPALLNTLRAARVTVDAAAIAVAIKTGGLGAVDLLFAPALLGVTSMLTEGALGTYMKQVGAELKKKQLAAVESSVLHGVVVAELSTLAQRLDGPGLFGVSAAELESVSAALSRWEHENDA